MCGNRVEELEARVKELEASIEGLTDELVECKVRLRELENAVDDDLGFEAASQPESPDSADAEPEAADRTKTEADEGSDNREDEAESDSESEIIVA